MDGTVRANIKPGMLVNIVLKKDQRSGTLTEGIVKRLLTSAPKHHRGIKVMLDDGQVGRVQDILDED
ncbi:YwbE family protein [Pedobacter arcticus]|uniref:YwbE family protein n=1 Tax=Pedobacter arcticus TaxID=752140 RepID=UPI0002DC6FE3|nr:YwbE family protein [Pedobacter arcticus]